MKLVLETSLVTWSCDKSRRYEINDRDHIGHVIKANVMKLMAETHIGHVIKTGVTNGKHTFLLGYKFTFLT